MFESEIRRQFCQELAQLSPLLRPARSQSGSDDFIYPVTARTKLVQDPQQRLRSVRVDSPVMILVLEGQKTLSIQDQATTFDRGDLFFIPQGLTFEFINQPAASGLYRALILELPQTLLDRFRQAYPEQAQVAPLDPDRAPWSPINLGVSLFAPLADALIYLIRTLTRMQPLILGSESAQHPDLTLYEQLHEHHLMEMMLLLLQSNIKGLVQQTVYPQFALQIRLLIRANLSSDYSMKQLAQALGMSISTLKRRLQEAQLNYRELLDEECMGKALELLNETDQSIVQIALACGYRSPSRFSARFRKYYNMSPSQVRARAQR